MEKEKIRQLVSQMTLEEKAGLCSGDGPWKTKAVDRLGIPQMWMSDGPHGLRKQENYAEKPDINDSLPAVSFPSECAMAASWDRELLRETAGWLGRESQVRDVHCVLGPGVNIKRSPLCGRNFEYLSEDPYLAGELGAAYVQGVQSEGVGACVKHYLANSQEKRRYWNSSEVDERTLRDIYLPAFETVVKKAKPMAVMASYNKINGTYATESRDRLVDLLRGEWGYDGCVMSDWGATHNRQKAVGAGCALTMPGEPKTDHEIVTAVQAGVLEEARVDEACEQILQMVYDGLEQHREGAEIDYDAEHEAVRIAEEQSAVLLKNEDGILPLKKGSKVAVIGCLAKEPRYQGGGSSHVCAIKVSTPYEALEALGELELTYADGYPKITTRRSLTSADFETTRVFAADYAPDEALIKEAVALAKDADTVLIFAGLPEDMETEGDDRDEMCLPDDQNALIREILKEQKNAVVVLQNGSPVELPWAEDVKGILELYLGGEAVGEAAADLLTGKVSPSGRLPESFPFRLEDNPSYLFYTGTGARVEYREGVYVGYRYYETKKMPVRYPFGYGLSYSTFSYSDLKVSREVLRPGETLEVSVRIKNTGSVAAAEVVQLYVGCKKCEVLRPVRELKGFDKVCLQPGEEKEVRFTLDERAFSYWECDKNAYLMAPGSFAVQIGKNAHEILLEHPVTCENPDNAPAKSTVEVVMYG